MPLFDPKIFDPKIFDTGAIPVGPQPAGGAWGRGKALTYGELMDQWDNESRRIKALEAREAQEVAEQPFSQKATIKATEPDKATELRKQIEQARIRLLALEQERKLAEERAKISRIQAEALARAAKAQKAMLEALEEEEAIAMTMMALIL